MGAHPQCAVCSRFSVTPPKHGRLRTSNVPFCTHMNENPLFRNKSTGVPTTTRRDLIRMCTVTLWAAHTTCAAHKGRAIAGILQPLFERRSNLNCRNKVTVHKTIYVLRCLCVELRGKIPHDQDPGYSKQGSQDDSQHTMVCAKHDTEMT